MDNLLATALVVSGVGMVTLFSALAILYGLMWLLTEVTQERTAQDGRPEEEAERGNDSASTRQRALHYQAAAIAVALAGAETDHQGRPSSPGGRASSAWWTLHHQRQLTQRPPARRGR